MSYQNVPLMAVSVHQHPVDPGFQATYEDKREYAWKYFGYPELSRWMAASRDSFVLRRFSTVSARTLLYLQHEIAKREKRLKILDEQSMKEPAEEGGCDSFDADLNTERGVLVAEMQPLLEKYYNLVNAFAQVRSLPTAREEHIHNLQNWNTNFPDAITHKEQHLFDLEQRGDMFPIVSRPKVPLRRILERSRLLRWIFKLKARPDRITEEAGATNFSDTGLDNLTNIFAILMGLALLFGPMWWLQFVHYAIWRLCIITVAILFFSGWLWIAGATKSFEILGGTAAYAAILMVYMQISGGSG